VGALRFVDLPCGEGTGSAAGRQQWREVSSGFLGSWVVGEVAVFPWASSGRGEGKSRWKEKSLASGKWCLGGMSSVSLSSWESIDAVWEAVFS
jgi:hypothetical protein